VLVALLGPGLFSGHKVRWHSTVHFHTDKLFSAPKQSGTQPALSPGGMRWPHQSHGAGPPQAAGLSPALLTAPSMTWWPREWWEGAC